MSALRITTRRTADIDAALQDAIVRMCTTAHGVDFGSLFSFLPLDGLHVIGWMNAEVAGHAVITTRWLQPEGLPILRTAYVDAVATSPAYQSRGIGSAVMRHLAEAVAAEDYEIAGLQSDLRGFYERLGWERWRGPLAGRTETGLAPTPDQDGVFILRLPRTPPLNLHGLLTIEEDGRIW
jgi:aminoglycoside 2'-N-acetyltransferase I